MAYRRRPFRLIADLKTCGFAFVTPREVAIHYHVSLDTVQRDIRKGALEAVRVGSGRQLRVPIDAAVSYGR